MKSSSQRPISSARAVSYTHLDVYKRQAVRRAAGQGQTLCIAFCDPGVRWFSAPRFAVARPDIDVRDDLYEGMDAARLLKERVYDLMVTPAPLADGRILSRPFLRDRVFLSVPEDSPLALKRSLSLRDIPAQPFLYPQTVSYTHLTSWRGR